MNTRSLARMAPSDAPRLLSAQEINAYLEALTESFNYLRLGFVRRGRMVAVPRGWKPEGLTIACLISGPARGFLALDIDPRLATRIARYMTPKRATLTDKDIRAALQMIGVEVIAGMQNRLVQMGIMAVISAPQVLDAAAWTRDHTDEIPVGVVPLYSTCGICHLAFSLII